MDRSQEIAAVEQACFDVPWSASVLADCMAQSRYVWETLSQNGQVVAYACGSISFDDGEILRVAVLPVYRRCGLAEKVLSAVLQTMADRGVVRFFLEVRAGNAPAKALYGKMGFRIIGVRKGYYPGGEDAVIMELGE